MLDSVSKRKSNTPGQSINRGIYNVNIKTNKMRSNRGKEGERNHDS